MGLIGSVVGDISGSAIEFFKPVFFDSENAPIFTSESRFTDDTVLACATKYAIIHNKDFTSTYQYFCKKYPNRCYGGRFADWIYEENPKPYNSYGNGSAMRVGYIADAFKTEKETLEVARESAIVTHNHPEGIKGAQVTALCGYMARTGASKKEIEEYAIKNYGPEYFESKIPDLQRKYYWNETCQGSVPLAIRCFLESESYFDFIRTCFKFDCDMDTICAIGGIIAENYYGEIIDNIVILKRYLPHELVRLIKK